MKIRSPRERNNQECQMQSKRKGFQKRTESYFIERAMRIFREEERTAGTWTERAGNGSHPPGCPDMLVV